MKRFGGIGGIGGTARGVVLAAAVLAGCGGSDGGTGSAPAAAPAQDGAAAADAAATSAGASAATGSTPTQAASPAPAPTPAPVAKTFADQVLDAVNTARATARRCGTVDHPAAPAMTWHAQPEQAALGHAQYLQQNNLFSHTGANGTSVGQRLTATGYAWSTVGENIAAGYPDVASVMNGWIDSPGHCANLMNGNFTHLGVVLVPGTSSNTYRTYWAMVLARPR
jgi:uncharacterized protein YkwD